MKPDRIVSLYTRVRSGDASGNPEVVMDGTPTTLWASPQKGGQWLRFDLGDSYHMSRDEQDNGTVIEGAQVFPPRHGPAEEVKKNHPVKSSGLPPPLPPAPSGWGRTGRSSAAWS
jgi:hypothetical protein